MAKTFAQHLINSTLPEGYKMDGPVTNRGLHDHVVDLARNDPTAYVRTALAIKQRGDELATLEGISVGLKDIRPNYGERDAILKPAKAAFEKAKTPAEREKIILETQAKIIEHTKQHPGSMTHMALSGARGNPARFRRRAPRSASASSALLR